MDKVKIKRVVSAMFPQLWPNVLSGDLLDKYAQLKKDVHTNSRNIYDLIDEQGDVPEFTGAVRSYYIEVDKPSDMNPGQLEEAVTRFAQAKFRGNREFVMDVLEFASFKKRLYSVAMNYVDVRAGSAGSKEEQTEIVSQTLQSYGGLGARQAYLAASRFMEALDGLLNKELGVAKT